MAYLGTKPANQVIDSTLIADGTITPSDLSTGKPVWDTSGNVGIGTSSPAFAGSRNGLVVKGNTTNGGELIIQTSVDTGSTGLALAKFGNDSAIANRSNGFLNFATNDTERMRIDSSGNVGIGNTVASTLDGSSSAANLAVGSGSGNEGITIYTGTANNGTLAFADGTSGADTFRGWLQYEHTNNAMTIGTNANERMRIDSSGRLLVGATSLPSGVISTAYVANTFSTGAYQVRAGASGAYAGNGFNINWTGSPQLWIDATNVGTFAFTSDYRVKRNVETQTLPALERVMALRPVTYQMADYGTLFKGSDDIKEGFIAHEVQEVIPSGAEGVKDAENQIQSLRVDAILSVAVKAIQEQQAMIEILKAKVEALEQA